MDDLAYTGPHESIENYAEKRHVEAKFWDVLIEAAQGDRMLGEYPFNQEGSAALIRGEY